MPISAPDPYAFAFGCSAGHVVSLSDLFDRQTVALRQSFELIIETWEKSIRQMTEGADIADRHGSQDLALRLRRRVAALEARIALFRDTFMKLPPPPELDDLAP